ncbi:hypothetical protein BJY04DRAFT_198950 [Aspergillus karnatakaensis]|uniref:uncharacterized protein n=1 Tax=Aspergillus karnatakaensis TaxID=1810916 RepID=UPI003CCCEB91
MSCVATSQVAIVASSLNLNRNTHLLSPSFLPLLLPFSSLLSLLLSTNNSPKHDQLQLLEALQLVETQPPATHRNTITYSSKHDHLQLDNSSKWNNLRPCIGPLWTPR